MKRLNTRNPIVVSMDSNSGLRLGSNQAVPPNGAGEAAGPHAQSGNENINQSGNSMQIPGQSELQHAAIGPNPGTMSSFSSLFLWILGGASSERLGSFSFHV